MTVATDHALMASLILVRLLAPTKSMSPSTVKKWLQSLFPTWDEEEFGRTYRQLMAEGSLAEKPLRLSDSGRESALKFLQVESLPPNTKWTTIKDRYLLAKALDRNPGGKALDAKQLAAHLIADKSRLPSKPKSLTATVEAFVCKELGYPELTSLQELRNAVVRKQVTFTGSPKAEQLGLLLAQKLGGVRGRTVGAMRESVLEQWVQQQRPASTAVTDAVPRPSVSNDNTVAPEPFDLDEFARTVQAAARRYPDGWFGDNKIFIRHAWDAVKEEPSFAGVDLVQFKSLLIDAHRQNHLSLSRADLVEALDPRDVRESETHFLNGTFHFLVIRREAP